MGSALCGYPFPITGHDWRELPEMMGLLCDAEGGGGRVMKRTGELQARKGGEQMKQSLAQYVKPQSKQNLDV